MKKFYLSLLLVLFSSNFLFAQTYEEDFRRVKETDSTWILVVSRPNCPPCDRLYNMSKIRNDVIATKIDISSPPARGLNNYLKSKNLRQFNLTPDWFVIRYKNGKLASVRRHIGAPSQRQLDKTIFNAKTQEGLNYSPVRIN